MRHDWIETFTGKAFCPLNPDPALIDIKDIAHSLSLQCRFSGHCTVHYSVAEHSVRVSELLRDRGKSREVQLWGLLHDASEAYLVDIPSPLKWQPTFKSYREAERVLMQCICFRFGLPPEEPPEVRAADACLLATEARDLMPNVPPHWEGLWEQPMTARLAPRGPQAAEADFYFKFKELTR